MNNISERLTGKVKLLSYGYLYVTLLLCMGISFAVATGSLSGGGVWFLLAGVILIARLLYFPFSRRSKDSYRIPSTFVVIVPLIITLAFSHWYRSKEVSASDYVSLRNALETPVSDDLRLHIASVIHSSMNNNGFITNAQAIQLRNYILDQNMVWITESGEHRVEDARNALRQSLSNFSGNSETETKK